VNVRRRSQVFQFLINNRTISKFTLNLGIVLISALFLGMSNTSSGLSLTIHIPNIIDVKGRIQIGLYDDKNNFPKIGKEYQRYFAKVDSNDFKYTIHGIPAGDYAIALYHDCNSDGMCNSNLIGIPTESYGFSNNVKPFLSAPSFGSTKFTISKDKTITIKLFH
jgi:uncharacterized protein (DUF2141 family)